MPCPQDSVGLSFDATDEDGSVWLYVALADRAGSVAVADVVGGAQDWDVCPRSHRRRGPARIAAYRADPVLSSCGLEAGVSYGLLAYVDQALPPFIGGAGFRARARRSGERGVLSVVVRGRHLNGGTRP